MNVVSLKLKALVDGQALGLFSLSCEHRAVTERGGKLPKEEKSTIVEMIFILFFNWDMN